MSESSRGSSKSRSGQSLSSGSPAARPGRPSSPVVHGSRSGQSLSSGSPAARPGGPSSPVVHGSRSGQSLSSASPAPRPGGPSSPLVRDRILDAAEEVLTRFGPQKTTVVDV